VYIVKWIGQSNMERNYTVGEIPSYIAGDIAGVKVWTGAALNSSSFLTLNQSATGLQPAGPILEFGYRLKEKYPSRDIRIVTKTAPNTRLYDDITAPGSWFPTSPASYSALRLYDDFVERYNYATEILPNYIDIGTCWGQGEGDAVSTLWATPYQTNESALKSDLDLVVGYATPFIAMNIRSAMTPGTYPEVATVRAAKATNLSGGVLSGLIETDGYSVAADNVHYTVGSSNAMANSFVSYF